MRRQTAIGREASAPRRRPGAPKGNTNAVKHGRFCAARRARRAESMALVRRARALIIQIRMVVRARQTLAQLKALQQQAKQEGRRLLAAPGSRVAPFARRGGSARPQSLDRCRGSPELQPEARRGDRRHRIGRPLAFARTGLAIAA